MGEKIKIWCDGAYKPSTNQGGIGIVWTKNGEIIKTYSKGYKAENLTNQIMEVLAAIVALNAVKNTVESIEVITDSMYVVGTMTKNWKRKANIKLWNKLDEIVNNLNLILQEPIKFTHTYGHANDEFNNIADKLADEASKEFIL